MTETTLQPPAPAPVAPPTKRRLLIASPCKGGLPAHYLVLHNQLISREPDGWSVEYLVEGANSAINISRNVCANEAIAQNFDRVLFLDTDMPASYAKVQRILSHDHEKVPIVSGMYCLKKPGKPFWLGIVKKGSAPDENYLQEAEMLPTGFLSVSVEALRKMCAYHKDREVFIQDNVLLPTPRQTQQTMYELFPIGINGPRTPMARLGRVRKAMEAVMAKGVFSATKPQMIEAMQGVMEALTSEGTPGYLTGEDYFFSILAKQAGIPLYMDVNCIVDHRGTIDYPIVDPAVVATSTDSLPELDGNPEEWQ